VTLEQRVEQLEKEMAAIRQSPDERPKCVKIPLSVFKFENPAIDSNNLSDAQIHYLSEFLNREIDEHRFIINVPW
jgi:hypothetical protein